HAAELRRSDLGKQPGQLDRGRMSALEKAVVVGELQHLLVGSLRQLTPAVAHIHAPQAGHRIEDAVAVRIVQVDTARTRNNPSAVSSKLLEVRERVEIVPGIGVLPFSGGSGSSEIVL